MSAADAMRWGLRDHHDGWRCTCGQRLWPDCDISAKSVSEEFERHLMFDHGVSRADIEEALTLDPL